MPDILAMEMKHFLQNITKKVILNSHLSYWLSLALIWPFHLVLGYG